MAAAAQGFNAGKATTTIDSTCLPIVDESLYRFFPLTDSSEAVGATTIESLNSRIGLTCTSSSSFSSFTSPATNNISNIANGNSSNKGQKAIIDDNERWTSDAVEIEGNVQTMNKEEQSAQLRSTTDEDDLDGFCETPGGLPQDNENKRGKTQLLFLVRHGQTDMNAAGRLQGRGVDAPLNAAGRAQADELGRFLRNVPFGTVTASSLQRAHEVRCMNVQYGSIDSNGTIVMNIQQQ